MLKKSFRGRQGGEIRRRNEFRHSGDYTHTQAYTYTYYMRTYTHKYTHQKHIYTHKYYEFLLCMCVCRLKNEGAVSGRSTIKLLRVQA